MDLFLKKKLSFVRPFSFLLLLLRKSSSLTPATRNPSPRSSFITNYLINSCGLSPHKAATASKPIAKLKFVERPEYVRHFLKQLGCSDANIRSIVSNHPTILNADVEKTLEPNLEALRALVQFSDPQFLKLVVYAPQLLTNTRAVARLEFWKDFLNGDSKKLLLAVTRNRGLVTVDVKSVSQRIELFRDNGLSKEDIVRMLVINCTGVFTMSVPFMKRLLKRVQELGFQPGSPLFVYGLLCLSSQSDDTFKAKMEIFKSYGWSEREFTFAFKKFPFLLNNSKERIQKKMEFLLGTAGCSPSYSAARPSLLGYSLEKRMLPRQRVISCLKMNKSIGKEPGLFTVMSLTDKNFERKFIQPYKDIESTLLEIYAPAVKVERKGD